MYISTNRALDFDQTDMSRLRNWISQTMVNYGIGNNTFAPLRGEDPTLSHSRGSDKWSFLVSKYCKNSLGTKWKQT